MVKLHFIGNIAFRVALHKDGDEIRNVGLGLGSTRFRGSCSLCVEKLELTNDAFLGSRLLGEREILSRIHVE